MTSVRDRCQLTILSELWENASILSYVIQLMMSQNIHWPIEFVNMDVRVNWEQVSCLCLKVF